VKWTKEGLSKIGIEKVDIYKGFTTKVLLDSEKTELFIYSKLVEKHGFELLKLNTFIIKGIQKELRWMCII